MKVHLHSEQFDRHLHAACGTVRTMTPEEGENIILGEDRFEKVAKVLRCRLCAKEMWPRGGEPE